jgi:TDP-4-amino-4,6-dideoxy-D-glucose deaminase
MNESIAELAGIFEHKADESVMSSMMAERLFPAMKDKNSCIKILRELFLRPYCASRELSEKFDMSKDELREAYLFMRSSREIRELFELSPYHYFIRVLNDLVEERGRTLKIIRKEKPFPLTKLMELFISESCNANCRFCYRNGGIYSGQKVLSNAEFVNIINEFADLQGEYLDISGGLEPLLGPAILDVLRTGIERNLKVSLYTNGIALDKPGLLDYLLRIDKVRISLNAYDRENYRDIIGVDQFDKVKDNIINFLKAREDSDSKVKIGIVFLVFKENYARIFTVIELAQELGIDFLDLRTIHVTGGGDFSDRQRKELASILRQTKREMISANYGRLSVSIADTFYYIVHENSLLKNLRNDYTSALVNFRVTVTASGKIYALNVIAQPTREDPRYLLGEFDGRSNLSDVFESKKDIPFEPELFLPHDISIVGAFSKLGSDLEFGIELQESPFYYSVSGEL